MQASDFTNDKPGKLVRNLDGHWAFVPAPLPGQLKWNNELGAVLSAAERALGRLMGVGLTIPNPRIVLRSFLRREAELSSRIENTFASLSDLALFEQTQSVEQRVPDVREVANNERALSFGLEAVQKRHRRVSNSVIKEMHRLLLEDARGEVKHPGEFRDRQVHIGKSRRIEEARFVPPPPLLVPELMDQLIDYIHAPSDLPPLARSAMIHYQFEAIHPFADGNGRIGRVLILMLLCAEKVLPLPLLNPSDFLERHRDEYYQHLLDVSQKGAWTEWVAFFARGVAEEAMDAVDRIDRLRSLQADYLRRLRSVRASSLLLRLVDELFMTPVMTVNRAAELLEVGYTSAQKNIDRLVRTGIAWEITRRGRDRLYFAGEIIEAVEGKPLSGDLAPPKSSVASKKQNSSAKSKRRD
jgi:Fic family protein